MGRHLLKLLTLIFFAGFCIKGFAQFTIEPPTTYKDSTIKWHGFYINPVIAAGFTMPFIRGDIKKGASIGGGAELSYMTKIGLGVSIGAGYQQYSFGYNFSNVIQSYKFDGTRTQTRSISYDTTVVAGYTTDASYSFSYIRLPLMARYITSGENKAGVWFEAGVVANILVNAQVSGSTSEIEYTLLQQAYSSFYNYQSSTTYNQDIIGVSPDAAKFTMSIHADVGAMIPASKKLFFVIAASGDFGLMNAGTGDNDIVKFTDATYYFYGQNSSYGSFSWLGGEVKAIFKL